MDTPSRDAGESAGKERLPAPRFPVSVKGVIIRDGQAVLLRNERDEWELPGGKLEPGESPEQCVVREIKEELGLEVAASDILDAWVYDISPGACVLVLAYGCLERAQAEAALTREHSALAWLPPHRLCSASIPEGYRRAILRWAERLQRPGGSTR